MMVAFMVPVPDFRAGQAVATWQGRIIVARTPAELREVPPAWKPIDLEKLGRISVTEWIGAQVGD